MNVLNEKLLEYMIELQPVFDGDLKSFYLDCVENNYPVIRSETLRFLEVLLSVRKPLKVLEIGCCVGYSACLFAHNLAVGGSVTTIERYKLFSTEAKINIAKYGFSDKITLIEGDANNVLPTLKGEFDLIFIDAGKGQYINFLPYCLDLLAVGGIFLADDVLQGGTVVDNVENIDRRNRTIHRRLNEFLSQVCSVDCMKTSVLPIGDGLVFGTKIF